jgi:hypothetical protein
MEFGVGRFDDKKHTITFYRGVKVSILRNYAALKYKLQFNVIQPQVMHCSVTAIQVLCITIQVMHCSSTTIQVVHPHFKIFFLFFVKFLKSKQT